ncbi:RNA polymerase factor sigma-54 [Zhaonella formicivorans]|uniref:RNA polymerase factor sigma-54 n=1 Tax=Zhaonella formicivorans TaxID=2528593 RepID=UPI0010DA5425|nr:RNA polymerase factor sigma-54 [Zhaonella formicivorans]
MRMSYGLNLEQTQKLIITPELKQAINILQLSTLELAEYIQQELLENPMLELKEEEEKEQVEPVEEHEIDWQEYFADKSDLGLPNGPKEATAPHSIENFLTQAPTLLEHLTIQLELLRLSPKEEEIGHFLLGNINGNGYLEIELQEAAEKCGCELAEVEKVLALIQGFEPTGVGARDLAECLLLQLRAKEWADPVAEAIIKNHLVDLAEGKWQKIAKALAVSPLEVQAAADLIKTLDPKPGSKYGNSLEPRYIIPDVVVEKVEGEYVVLVNDSSTPRLGVNPVYQALMKREKNYDEETVKFVEQKLNSALWVIKSIEQRRLTLYKVVNCIISFQREFFERGLKALKPLTLKQVADVLGIHESTVSRATAHKYVQTPLGVFELKFFFANGVESSQGTSTSAQSVKATIQELVDSEDPRRPYTDQQLAELLTQRGISISRRTVTKYRDEQGIPAAAKRKRF